jgi:cephalosporin hydroxylase
MEPLAENWTAANLGPIPRYEFESRLSNDERRVADDFHRLYYGTEDQQGPRRYFVSWLGFPMFKCPLDMWIYQELITALRPELIIETGTYKGGSALYLATLCDLLDHGRVITIDIDAHAAAERPQHPRIEYLIGSSVDPAIVAYTRAAVRETPNALVILDSDHRTEHVAEELRVYSPLVPPGGYLIVEDTNVGGHPAYPEFGPGPWEAVQAFLAEHPEFAIDRSCERFLLTMNPSGYLRRVG